MCVCVHVRTREKERETDRQTDIQKERPKKEIEKQKQGERQADRDIQTQKEIQTDRDGVGAGLVFMYEGGVCLCFWSCGVFFRVSNAFLFIISVPLCVAGSLCLSVHCVSVPLLSFAVPCGDQVRFPTRAV